MQLSSPVWFTPNKPPDDLDHMRMRQVAVEKPVLSFDRALPAR
jgi:hypothetical protein